MIVEFIFKQLPCLSAFTFVFHVLLFEDVTRDEKCCFYILVLSSVLNAEEDGSNSRATYLSSLSVFCQPLKSVEKNS